MCLTITATQSSQSFFQSPGQEKKEPQDLDFLSQPKAFERIFLQMGRSTG
jgi:hypothetical protein